MKVNLNHAGKKVHVFLNGQCVTAVRILVRLYYLTAPPAAPPNSPPPGNICIYCPGGPDSDFEYSTQSYTGYEPTSMRAIRARYNPYVQARGRVDQLRKLGHSVDKVGLGGGGGGGEVSRV